MGRGGEESVIKAPNLQGAQLPSSFRDDLYASSV